MHYLIQMNRNWVQWSGLFVWLELYIFCYSTISNFINISVYEQKIACVQIYEITNILSIISILLHVDESKTALAIWKIIGSNVSLLSSIFFYAIDNIYCEYLFSNLFGSNIKFLVIKLFFEIVTKIILLISIILSV